MKWRHFQSHICIWLDHLGFLIIFRNMYYQLNINNPQFNELGYIKAVANVNDKHDRSAPSDYHWKILKCRMLIFSNSSILACPDKQDIKKVHIIFNKTGDDYDKLNSLLLKYSLAQEDPIGPVTPEMYQMTFQYTMVAKLAPMWNSLGTNYLVNNRDFLTAKEPQEGIKYHTYFKDQWMTLKLKPVKINLLRCDNDYLPGECIRVLPSLNKAIIEENCSKIPKYGIFKCYKDLRRHWKNIHGYRLPEEDDSSYCLVRFWRGDPLTYPKICVTRSFPIVTPLPKPEERKILNRFTNTLKQKFPSILGSTLMIQHNYNDNSNINETMSETQAVSLCTPTQNTSKTRKVMN